MKKYSLFFCFVLIAGVVSVVAQPKGYKAMKDTSVFVKKFNEKSKAMNTNEADFTQEKYVSVMTDKAVSKGKFYYKKENKMRWESTEPKNHIIVLNNGKMTIKEKGKVKTYDASANKMFKSLNDMMLTTASGNMLQNKDYKYSLFESEKYYLIQLTPQVNTTKKFVRVIEISVEKSDYTVAQIKIIEPSEDYTRIEFTNKKINLPVGDDKFILK